MRRHEGGPQHVFVLLQGPGSRARVCGRPLQAAGALRRLVDAVPRPEAILCAIAYALGLVPKQVAAQHLDRETLEELAAGPMRRKEAGT